MTSSTMYKAPQAALFKGPNASADTLVSRSSARPNSPTSFKTAVDDMVVEAFNECSNAGWSEAE
jgi:hypothetical protein